MLSAFAGRAPYEHPEPLPSPDGTVLHAAWSTGRVLIYLASIPNTTEPEKVTASAYNDLPWAPETLKFLVTGPELGPARSDTRLNVLGPDGRNRPQIGLSVEQAERFLGWVLNESLLADRAELKQRSLLWGRDLKKRAGVVNEYLFVDTKIDEQFERLARTAKTDTRLLNARNENLLKGLGCDLKPADITAGCWEITENGILRAVAVFLDGGEHKQEESERHNGMTPLVYAFAHAEKVGAAWVVIVARSEIWLHPAANGAGVGDIGTNPNRGREDVYAAVNLALVPPGGVGYLYLFFSGEAFKEGGHLKGLSDSSEQAAKELAGRFRRRVHDEAFPMLATAVTKRLADKTGGASPAVLREAYPQAQVVLFRLMFLAYIEQNRLLPVAATKYYNASLGYATDRLTQNGMLGNYPGGGESTLLWDRVVRLWKAVDEGDPELGVPSYNVSMFSAESDTGKEINELRLADTELVPVMKALLLDTAD